MRLLALHVTVVLLFAVYVSHAAWAQGFAAAGVLLCALAAGLMLLAPRYPALGLVVFIVAAYSLPRYGADLRVVASLGLFTGLAATGLTGLWAWRANAVPRPAPLAWTSWPLLLMALFIGWGSCSFLVARVFGAPFEFDPLHHPMQLLQGAALMLVATVLLQRRRPALFVLGALCLVPLVRVLLQQEQGIYLDGDLPALSVMVLPFALLATGLHWRTRWRVLFALLAAALLAVVWVAQNRGAALGLALALLALWLNARNRLRWLLAMVLVAVMAAAFAPRAYFDRFSVIWNRSAAHATAGLDRATMDERLELWRTAAGSIAAHPLLGLGPGRETQALRTADVSSHRLVAHNSFISVALETGVVGLILFSALFLGAIAQLQQLIRRTGDSWQRQQARMVQAALCAFVGVGLVISRYDMPLAYLLLGWALALQGAARDAAAPAPVPGPDPGAKSASAAPPPGAPASAGRAGQAIPTWFRLGVAGYAAFVAFGSLVPMHLVPRDPGLAWHGFWQVGPGTLGTGDRSDWAVNFLLLVPLAFGWRHLIRAPRRAGGLVASALVAAALLVFSLSIEFAQMFFPPRNPSFNDVLAQFVGTLVGLALHHRLGARFGGWLQRLGTVSGPLSRLHALLALYLVLLLAFNVMPLDLSISPIELYRKWRDGRIILLPLGAPIGDLGTWFYDLLTDVALWIPVGLLWRIDGSARSLRTILLRVALASAAIELAQLFVLSRVTDVTDVLLAVLGGGLGVALADAAGRRDVANPQILRPLAVLGWWLWLPIMLALFWWPFDFIPARLSDGTLWHALTRMPFDTYYARTEFGALNEIVRKMALLLPGGLLLALAVRNEAPGRFHALAWVLVALAVIVEGGQVMLPGRVASATDVLLEAAGGWLGWRLGRWLRADAARAPLPS